MKPIQSNQLSTPAYLLGLLEIFLFELLSSVFGSLEQGSASRIGVSAYSDELLASSEPFAEAIAHDVRLAHLACDHTSDQFSEAISHAPYFNIDGTPMLDDHFDFHGHPYGVIGDQWQ